MKSWEIFWHSAQLVFRNFRYALVISVPVLVTTLLQLVLGSDPASETPTNATTLIVDNSVVLTDLVLYVLRALATLWAAVAWHRFVLLEEYPKGFLPTWYGSEMLRYFLMSILLGLILVGLAMVVLVPSMLLIQSGGSTALTLSVIAVLGAFLGVFWLRMAAVLPSRAMGERLSIGAALEKTRGAGPHFLMLLVIWVIAFSILVAGLTPLVLGVPALGIVTALAANWLIWMVSISTLTTIHGVYIEGRAID